MFRIRAQYVERIIWIVIILILLIALVVVSVYKTEACVPGTEETPVSEEEPAVVPEPEPVPTPAPVPTPKPSPTPEPTTPTPASGKISFSIDRLDCQPMSAAGNLTRAKINSIGLTLENGKSTPLVAEMTIYIWDIAHEDEKDIARTGEVPVRIGAIAAGKTFNDFVNVRNKPTTFIDTSRDHNLKLEILDETDKIVASKQAKFKLVGTTCQLV